jgi:F-type H+-transporting ATPase subunit b
MPQFDFATVFWPQLIWLTIIFSVLFFGIVLPTLPKLGRVIDAREEKVRGDVEAAEAAKQAADATQAANLTSTASAQEAARQALAVAKAKAAASVEKKLAAANAKITEKLVADQAVLEAARSKAMTEVTAVAGDSAADIVEKLGGVRPSSAAVTSALASISAGAQA